MPLVQSSMRVAKVEVCLAAAVTDRAGAGEAVHIVLLLSP
jgi:hypothetical protein